MTTKNPTILKPGDVLAQGDLIQRTTAYVHHQYPEWEHRDTKQHPIQQHMIGRVILPADLHVATFFRP